MACCAACEKNKVAGTCAACAGNVPGPGYIDYTGFPGCASCGFVAPQQEPQTPQTALQRSISLGDPCCAKCAKSGGNCAGTNQRALSSGTIGKRWGHPNPVPPVHTPVWRQPPPNRVLHGLGAAAATTPSNTTTYVVVGGAAVALGLLAAILYKRHTA